MDSTTFDFLSRNANIRVRKLLGRTYLRENRLEEACEVYTEILRANPGDADVLTIFGNLYRLSGSPATAEHLYSRALESNPNNVLLKKQIAEVHEEKGVAAEEALPFIPEAIARLLARLRGAPEQAEAARTAADMLDRLLAEPQPPSAAAESSPAAPGAAGAASSNGFTKDDLQQLMPALIELNIRQARADGRADLAEALQSLQIHLSQQTKLD